MKKWIWIPITILLTFVGDRLGGYVLNYITVSSQFRYSRLYSGAAQADILLIGNSRGLSFYQPEMERLTGKKTFNFSYNALPCSVGELLLEDYYSNYEVPEYLIMDVTMISWVNDRLAADFRLYTPYSNRLQVFFKSEYPSLHLSNSIAHLSRYGGEIAQRVMYYFSKSDEDWLLDRNITTEKTERLSPAEVLPIDFPEHKILSMKKVLDDLESKGTKIVLVVNPYYPEYYNLMPDFNKKIERVSELMERPVLDYGNAIRGKENYGDFLHLNVAGGKKYVQLLCKDLSLLKN